MGKKYLETKNDSLESSILGLWQTAIEEGEAIKDAAQMTKGVAKEVTKEEVELDQLTEASGDKEAYKKFFNSVLKKFKVSSPAELKGDAKKKFYDYIDANWEADNEKAEAAMSQVREFKVQSMKAALAQVWGIAEGELPPALKKAIDAKKKDKDDEEEVKKESVELDEADWAVTFQKGSRVGARSHKIIYVQAKDEDDAVKKAKAGKGDGPKPEKGFSVSSVRKEGVAWENAQRFKVESMKAALAQIWGVKEGHNPFKKEDDDKILKKGGKTLTGKKAAEIDLNPEIKDR